MSQFSKPNKNNTKKYLRFSGLAFEMLAFILLGVWGGLKLDEWLGLDKPIMTACCSLLGVGASMFYLIRNLPKT